MCFISLILTGDATKPFSLPKKPHRSQMPDSMRVCLTIGFESVSRLSTFCCIMSCKAFNSASYLRAGISFGAFRCVSSRKYIAIFANLAANEKI